MESAVRYNFIMSKTQIEKTAKKFKAVTLACWIGFVVSCWCFYDDRPEVGAAVLAGVIVTGLINKFLIWWNHG